MTVLCNHLYIGTIFFAKFYSQNEGIPRVNANVFKVLAYVAVLLSVLRDTGCGLCQGSAWDVGSTTI